MAGGPSEHLNLKASCAQSVDSSAHLPLASPSQSLAPSVISPTIITSAPSRPLSPLASCQSGIQTRICAMFQAAAQNLRAFPKPVPRMHPKKKKNTKVHPLQSSPFVRRVDIRMVGHKYSGAQPFPSLFQRTRFFVQKEDRLPRMSYLLPFISHSSPPWTTVLYLREPLSEAQPFLRA